MLFSEKNVQLDLIGLNVNIGGKPVDQVGSQCKEKYF